MIFADLQGKLGRDYSLAHNRAEDLLTSTVFQLLRYLPIHNGFLPLLRAARAVGGTPWNIDHADGIDVQLWPRIGTGCCPDVLLGVTQGRRLSHAILIEAKLFSGKSRRAVGETHALGTMKPDEDAETEGDAARIDPDQLARYWRGLRARFAGDETDCGVIYLTGHLTPPTEELAASLTCAPDMRLAWLSWYDVWKIADQSPKELLVAEDLARFLKNRGYATFHGFGTAPCGVLPKTARFFDRGNWFAQSRNTLPSTKHFWSET